jgi:predicted RNA-binding protein
MGSHVTQFIGRSHIYLQGYGGQIEFINNQAKEGDHIMSTITNSCGMIDRVKDLLGNEKVS